MASIGNNPGPLMSANHGWLRDIALGFGRIATGVTGLFGVFFLAVAISTLYTLFRALFMRADMEDHEWMLVPTILIYGVMFLMPTLAVFARPVWLFTTPEPGAKGRQIIRQTTRWLGVAAGISSLVVLPCTLGGPVMLYLAYGGVCVACLWLWAATLIGLGLMMLGFAWRAGRVRLVGETVLVVLVIAGIVWGTGIALALALAGVIGNAVGLEEEQELVSEVSGYVTASMIGVTFLLYLLMIVVLGWVILLFRRYAKMFKQAVA